MLGGSSEGARRARGGTVGTIAAGWLAATAALVAGGGEGHPEPASAAHGPARPNVVVVMSDDQEISSMRVMEKVRRLLRRNGVAFRRSYASFPLCCPSRATFLTGQYAHNHGVLSNEAADGGGFEGFQDSGSLPQALREAGYRTGYVGKYLNGYNRAGSADPSRIPDGWDVWRAQVRPRMFNFQLNEQGRIRTYRGQRNHQTDVFARKAATFIRNSARRNRPFFLKVAPLAVHTEAGGRPAPNPRPAPRHRRAFAREPMLRLPNFNEADVSDKPSFIRRLARLDADQRKKLRGWYRARLASLLAVDDLVARVVRQLRRSSVLGRTYVIFTSDNGMGLGAHRRLGKPTLYERTVRVPLVIRGPGVPRGQVRGANVVNVDLAPTIYELTGAPPLREPDGRSLTSPIADPEAWEDRPILLHDNRGVAVRDRESMYAEYELPAGTEYELYDMGADPHQLENLLDPDTGELKDPDPKLRARLDGLRARLAALRSCAGASCNVR